MKLRTCVCVGLVCYVGVSLMLVIMIPMASQTNDLFLQPLEGKRVHVPTQGGQGLRTHVTQTTTTTTRGSPASQGEEPKESVVVVVQNETKTKRSAKATDDGTCTFAGTFEENLIKLKSLPFTNSRNLTDNLGFNKIPKEVMQMSLPVIVTGASSAFYKVVQGLIKSIHEKLVPKYPDLRLIVYDMGFRDSQYEAMVKYCRCEVRKMPFDKLPTHVRTLKNYAFKPIIANEFGSVWWVDSSVRFISDKLDEPVNYLRENGALFFTYAPILNVALHTHKDMFTYFEEEPCPYMYFGEIEAGNVAFINNEVGRIILNRWVSCALDASCITPNGAEINCVLVEHMTMESVGKCHRYDQSALSIVLRRLYHVQNDYPLVKNPFRLIEVRRGQTVKYFPDN